MEVTISRFAQLYLVTIAPMFMHYNYAFWNWTFFVPILTDNEIMLRIYSYCFIVTIYIYIYIYIYLYINYIYVYMSKSR